MRAFVTREISSDISYTGETLALDYDEKLSCGSKND